MTFLAIFGWVVLVLMMLGCLFFASRVFMMAMYAGQLGSNEAPVLWGFLLVVLLLAGGLGYGVCVSSPFEVSVGVN